MKKISKFFALATVMFAFTAGAFAQLTNTATATATATIVTPLTIENKGDLSFGKIAPGTGGNVTVAPTGTRSTTGPLLMGGTVNAGTFDVSGAFSTSYSITFPTFIVVTNGTPANDMTVNAFLTNSTGALDPSGKETFNFGATLSVAAAQPNGIYTSAPFNVTVVYP